MLGPVAMGNLDTSGSALAQRAADDEGEGALTDRGGPSSIHWK